MICRGWARVSPHTIPHPGAQGARVGGPGGRGGAPAGAPPARPPPPAVRVNADADLVSQALSNLLDNALKYTPRAGDVAVEVARDDGMVRLAVSNSGEG